jgi:cathepsin X
MPIGEDITDTQCWPVKEFTTYRVREYGRIHGEAAIMSEVFARGPVVCGMATTHHFDYNYTGGVYIDTTNANEVNHDVEIVGWGQTEAGVPYWNVRNSWGTYWGQNGFFKVLRGKNNLRIEENCMFAIVDLSGTDSSPS